MFRFLKRLLACLAIDGVFFSTVACAWQEVEFLGNVEYGDVGGEKLRLNLARPREGTTPRAAVIVIHGGGWSGGKKESHDEQIKDLAKRGFLAVTVGYRLAPKQLFPAPVEDCQCAVRWLRAHCDEMQIDPNRIGAIGFSAGGHLAMMLGVANAADGFEKNGGWSDQESKVQAVVSFAGPTNLASRLPEGSTAIVERFIGKKIADGQAALRRASPIQYVDQSDAPMLLFQGMRDEIVPYDQAVQMVAALSDAGVPGRVELLLSGAHGWGSPEAERTFAEAYAFLDEQLRPTAKSPNP